MSSTIATPAKERRSAPRHTSLGGEPWARVRLRAGRELIVVDASASGLLVEGEVRLLPGTRLDVHVQAATGRVLVRSHVVRAYVACLDRDRVIYRGALALERMIDFGQPEPARLPERTA
jgi:hypothetical protein